jgi:hypothetical protein
VCASIAGTQDKTRASSPPRCHRAKPWGSVSGKLRMSRTNVIKDGRRGAAIKVVRVQLSRALAAQGPSACQLDDGPRRGQGRLESGPTRLTAGRDQRGRVIESEYAMFAWLSGRLEQRRGRNVGPRTSKTLTASPSALSQELSPGRVEAAKRQPPGRFRNFVFPCYFGPRCDAEVHVAIRLRHPSITGGPYSANRALRPSRRVKISLT